VTPRSAADLIGHNLTGQIVARTYEPKEAIAHEVIIPICLVFLGSNTSFWSRYLDFVIPRAQIP
jgi:hypothetical protein